MIIPDRPQVDCPECNEPVKYEHAATAVYVHVWSPRLGRNVQCGPFHGECGNIFNKRIQNLRDGSKEPPLIGSIQNPHD